MTCALVAFKNINISSGRACFTDTYSLLLRFESFKLSAVRYFTMTQNILYYTTMMELFSTPWRKRRGGREGVSSQKKKFCTPHWDRETQRLLIAAQGTRHTERHVWYGMRRSFNDKMFSRWWDPEVSSTLRFDIETRALYLLVITIKAYCNDLEWV